MLLFRKPLSDIQIGESFQVTVAEDDWKLGARAHSESCAVVMAVRRAGFVGTFCVDAEGGWTDKDAYVYNWPPNYLHDGEAVIRAFDRYAPFPGNTVVTFTRES